MPVEDPRRVREERYKQRITFYIVLKHSHYRRHLGELERFPAAPSVTIAKTSGSAISTPTTSMGLPQEIAKTICDFAFPACDKMLWHEWMHECMKQPRRNYSRLPGQIVLQDKARVGERVRRTVYPAAVRSGKLWEQGDTIVSLEARKWL